MKIREIKFTTLVKKYGLKSSYIFNNIQGLSYDVLQGKRIDVVDAFAINNEIFESLNELQNGLHEYNKLTVYYYHRLVLFVLLIDFNSKIDLNATIEVTKNISDINYKIPKVLVQ